MTEKKKELLVDEKEDFRKAALHYHQHPKPGKISVNAIKPMVNQRDLSLAYSPGVAYACEEIENNPLAALDYTAKGNLVAVISNGTAVLGLGDIGALAGKPVMEGKGVLFKKFSGIDVFDIEIDEKDPDKLIEIIASLEPTFGGINLEDIKAPECFYIESELKKRMNIPVFHDDQHGTAIIVAAGVLNGLKLTEKKIEEVKLVCSGAGAAAIACLKLLVHLGLNKKNILICDSKGVVNHNRDVATLDQTKIHFQNTTAHETLEEALEGADIFLGLSAPGLLSKEMIIKMAEKPLIFALANPEPEIRPELALSVRPDAILATGRSDYPNQINNVLCFPYLFRGALDCGATEINEEMKLACVKAIADLAHREVTEEVVSAYKGEALHFGKEYIIPKPFDTRLIVDLPIAVAKAAMDSGVALRPIKNFDKYAEHLSQYIDSTSMVMKPVFELAKTNARTIIYSEGENMRVLRAIHIVKQDNLANPVLIGRPEVIQEKLKSLSINLEIKVLSEEDQIDKSFDLDYVQVIDQRKPPYLEECAKSYYKLVKRKGITPEFARQRIRTESNILGAMLLKLGYVDGQICGAIGQHHRHVSHLMDIIGLEEGINQPSALSLLLSSKGPMFFSDTHVNIDPSAEALTQITLRAADLVRRFGFVPKVALLSHSNFGSRESAASTKMAKVLALLKEQAPDLKCDGEMQPELAIKAVRRTKYFPDARFDGAANLFIFSSLDSASITYNMLKTLLNDAVTVAPIITGFAKPAHVLTNVNTSRGIVNLTAICATDVICQ